MAWVTPVIDRTQDDVVNRTEKGRIVATDINRVEGNIQVLSDMYGLGLTTREWSRSMIPSVSDYQRILDNIDRLRSNVVVYITTPETPRNPLNTWQKWNDAERILSDVYVRYYEKESIYNYAGEIYAGQLLGVL